jgi:hypothetical protein
MIADSSSVINDALERLAKHKDAKHVIVVRAILRSKKIINELEDHLAPVHLRAVIELSSDHVASMCSLIDAEFNADILPSVELVEQYIEQSLRKTLQ